jgi:hypothetical protein
MRNMRPCIACINIVRFFKTSLEGKFKIEIVTQTSPSL